MEKFQRVIYDIETNGFLDVVDTIHCCVVKCIDTGEVFSGSPGDIEEAIRILKEAREVVGHNILGYDNRVIEKLRGFNLDSRSTDTLTLSRLIYAHILQIDFAKRNIPTKLFGRHSLEAWGRRLGDYKGDYKGGWDRWSPEMQSYCEQDVEVTHKLYNKLMEWDYSSKAIDLEHKFQCIIEKQMAEGMPFNVSAAKELAEEIGPAMSENRRLLRKTIPYLEKKTIFIPKRDNKTLGYKKDTPFEKVQQVPFNPGSRQQIIEFLKLKYKWNPVDFTDNGNPSVGREVLEKLTDWEEVPLIMEYLDQAKLAGQLYSGKNAWLKLVRDGRIHGRVITNGAITGRCTHSSPNLGQVPSLRAYKGKECRSLFYAPEGYSLVGADASGLELRMLAHYLHPYDNGEFAREVIHGDIHTANQEAAGLPTRDNAKTFIYAFNYGAGDAKLGSILEPKASESRQRSIGSQLRSRFLAKNPAIKRLINDVRAAYKRKGWLKGLDGRMLFPRSAHKTLNTLLQGGGAVVMKEATVLVWDEINFMDIPAIPGLHVHDEWQIIAPVEYAETVGALSVKAIHDAGKTLNLNVELDGEYKVGGDWSETH